MPTAGRGDFPLRSVWLEPVRRNGLVFPFAKGIGPSSNEDPTATVVWSDWLFAAPSAITATLSQTLANATLAATGGPYVQGTLSVTLDAATLAATASGSSAVNGSLSVTLDAATLAATGQIRVTGSLAQTLGAATLVAAGGPRVAGVVNQTLAAATLAAVGDVDVTGSLALTLAAATLAATATVSSAVNGSLSVTLEGAGLAASGQVRIAAVLGQTLGDATLVGAFSSPTGAADPSARRFVFVGLPYRLMAASGQERVTAVQASPRTVRVPNPNRVIH